MAIWEYLITTFSGKPENLSTWLNEKGKEGWELVHVERPTYWFKRQEGMMEANFGKIAKGILYFSSSFDDVFLNCRPMRVQKSNDEHQHQ